MINNREPFPHQMPPPLGECIKAFETDLDRVRGKQIPIDRVFILGAGFSRAFGFTTSAEIVRGVMNFIEMTLAMTPQNEWLERNHRNVEIFLNNEFPNWRESSPDLIEVANRFFPNGLSATFIDPLNLHNQNKSWENENYLHNLPTGNYKYAMLSFEALLCFYLFNGLSIGQVLIHWAEEFIKKLTKNDIILTFNWDVIPEALLTQTGKPFSRYEWLPGYVKLVKLHGSVDLIGVPNRAMRTHVQFNPYALERLTPLLWRAVTAEEFFPERSPWEWYNKSALLVMPPFYTLGYGYKLIQFNWRKAEAALLRAKQVHIIGYSLCENDQPFRNLLKSVSSKWPKHMHIKVWNTDESVAERANLLCGSNRIDFHQCKASEIQL